MKPDDGQIRMAVNDMLGKTLRRAFTVEEFELAYQRLKHDESFLKPLEESFREINFLIEQHEAERKAKRAAEKTPAPVKSDDEPKPAEEETRHLMQYRDSEGRLHLATR